MKLSKSLGIFGGTAVYRHLFDFDETFRDGRGIRSVSKYIHFMLGYGRSIQKLVTTYFLVIPFVPTVTVNL